MRNKKIFLFVLAAAFSFAFFSECAFAVTFAVMGDTKDFVAGNAAGGTQLAAKLIKKKKVRATIVVGDLINDCLDEATCATYFANWKSAVASILKKTYPAMGNHDRVCSNADALWQSTFSLPKNGPVGYSELAYAFNKGDSHFVVLNSSKPENNVVNADQRNWLEQDLTQSKKKNTFVFFHAPAYPVSAHIGSALDAYPAERDALWEILDRHKVTAVFSGHEHLFARRKIDSSIFSGATRSIHQLIVGNTDTAASPAPLAGLTDYFNLEKHFLIVKTSKKKIVTVLYSATTGKKLNSFSFKK